MVIELSDEQRLAVIGGLPVTLESGDAGTLIVLRKFDFQEMLDDAREKAEWVSASRKALNRWCEENPFEL